MARKPTSNRTKNTTNLSQSKQHDRNMSANSGPGVGEYSQDSLDKVINRFKSSRSYTRKGFWDTWDQCWKLYSNQRVMVNYEGASEAFIPETFSIVEAIKAHIVSGDPHVKFMPRRQDQQGDIQILQDLFDYAWDRDDMSPKVDSAVTEMLVTGNSYIFTYVGDEGLPCSRYVAAKDAFFDPTATDKDSLRYCGYRYLTTLKELRDTEITNENYDGQDETSEVKVKRYKNLDQIDEGFKNNGNDKTAKQEREDMIAGTILDDTTDVVECIVYIDFDKMITIANRTTIIEEVDTPFKRDSKMIDSHDDDGQQVQFELPEIEPFLPVATFRDYVDGNMFYAKGEVEIIGESQERLNDTSVQKQDSLSYLLNRMWTLDPAYAHKIDEVQSIPGAVLTIPPGALEQVQQQPMGADADNQISEIKSEMRRAVAADEIMFNDQRAMMSKFQVQAQLNEGTTRFATKLKKLEREGFRQLGENMWKIMQIYIDREIAVRVEGNDGVNWKTYNPGEFLGEYDVKVTLNTTADAAKEAEKQQSMQFFLLASKFPFIDQQKLFAMTAQTQFDKSRQQIEELVAPPPATPPPAIQPKLMDIIKFEQLTPFEQGQLLAEQGITPDPVREKATGMPNAPVNPNVIPHPDHVLPPDNGTGGGGGLAGTNKGRAVHGGATHDNVASQPAGNVNIPGIPQA